MDPTAALSEIRRMLRDEEWDEETVQDILGHVRALDEWLSGGGFLPEQWARQDEPKRPVCQGCGTRIDEDGYCPSPGCHFEGKTPIWSTEERDPEYRDGLPVCPKCSGELRNVAEVDDMRDLVSAEPGRWVFDGFPEYTDPEGGRVECAHCLCQIRIPDNVELDWQ